MMQPPFRSLTRRAFWLVAAGIWSLAVGCSRRQALPEGPSESLSPSESRPITHALGTTRVPKVPQRIVALTGSMELEALLVLDVKPFAAAGDDRDRQTVWQPHMQDQLQGVEMLPSRRNISLEKVAVLQPDLILCALVFQVESIYPQLSQIAPTVALDASQPWQSHLRLIAEVVDQTEHAETWITNFEQRLTTLENTYREQVAGITYTTVSYTPGQRQVHMTSGHELDQVLQQIGLTRPPEHAQIGEVQRGALRRANISLERLDLIDTDLIFFYQYAYPTVHLAHELPELNRFLEEEPLFRGLRAIETNRAFFVPANYWFLGRSLGIPLIVEDLETLVLPIITR